VALPIYDAAAMPIRPETREFFAGWTRGVVLVLISVAAIAHVSTFFNDKFNRTTGEARWIWDRNELASGQPRAFFVSRSFDLPSTRRYTHIKIAADPEYTLFFNGREIGGSKGEPRQIDVYDVSSIAHDRANRIVIAIRSRTGAGGLLASIDLAPDFENAIVSDASWSIDSRWSDSLLVSDGLSTRTPATELGRPPFGRWNYLPESKREWYPQRWGRAEPHGELQLRTSIPQIRTISGMTIQTSVPIEARAYDFGQTRGRARLSNLGAGGEIRLRFANTEEELAGQGEIFSYIAASGESHVRYIIVLGHGARPSVLTP
jgi:hypothetical protein